MSAEKKAGADIFWPLLAVAFIVLKLVGVIGWSWWWVLAPLWGPLAVGLGLFFFVGAVALAALLMALLGTVIQDLAAPPWRRQ